MAGQQRSRVIGDLQLTHHPEQDEVPVAAVLELNALFPGSLTTVTEEFFRTWSGFSGDSSNGPPGQVRAGLAYVTNRLYQVVLSRTRLADLIAFDASPDRGRPPTIFKAWPDYPMRAHIDRSAATVKADAAYRAFSASGAGIVWAVIDSGIDAGHGHFAGLGIADDADPAARAGDQASPTYGLHRDFTHLVPVGPDPEGTPVPEPGDDPLTDEAGHGTHVAGIIAGRCPPEQAPHIATGDEPVGTEGFISRLPAAALAGMAPDCELVSLKVLRRNSQGLLVTSSSAVLRALDYLCSEVNTVPGMPRVHGVNLSLGCDWDPAHYAAGRSPLCQAIDEAARRGLFVVVSAGNSGYSQADDPNTVRAALGSISEPAHAQKCIAVGSTHRDAPHVFGVTYTSGKGPTLDGRSKPDVVAPGEWITSAATGSLRERAGMGALPGEARTLAYAPDSGTSMAAAHVSGVIAAFLSVRPEYIGRVDEVKQIIRATTTDLGRERYAQGHGLIDLMRMLSQS